MRYIILILLFVFSGISTVQSQQLPMYSQYMHNDFVLNPAIAGTHSYYAARFAFRKQWAGFERAPSTQTLSYHMPFKDQKMGAGGYIYNDQVGPIRRTGLNGAYAYHLKLSDNKTISMGLKAGFFQYAIDNQNLTTQEQGDDAIQQENATLYAPTAGAGAHFSGENFFVSLSVPQLIPVDVNMGNQVTGGLGQLVPHFYLYGGYHYVINDKFSVEPSTLFKTTAASPLQLDLNVKGYYKEQYWLGLSYRNSFAQQYQHKDLVFALGVTINETYHAGYSYDLSLGEIAPYHNGSHEITLGYNFSPSQSKSAAPRL